MKVLSALRQLETITVPQQVIMTTNNVTAVTEGRSASFGLVLHAHCAAHFCQFRFFRVLHCWASPQKKITYWIEYSLTHPSYL